MHSPALLLCLTLAAGAQTPNPDSFTEWRDQMRPIIPRHYVCPRAKTPPVIDGNLSDPVWAAAPWTADFVDIQGAAKPKPRLRTRAKMMWDDDFFYIAAELEEPDVWATLTKHDAVIFNDPDFEVFIDPGGGSHDYFEFEINALNTSWDLYLNKPYKDRGKPDDHWNVPGLRSAVQVRGTLNQPSDRDHGWTVELAFPWRAYASRTKYPLPPREGGQMRVGFSRVEWQVTSQAGKYVKTPKLAENNWIWSPQGVIDMHRPERWGYVQFSRDAAVKFVPDPSAPARDVLHDVYYSQRAFFKQHGRWAGTLAELGLPAAAHASIAAPVLTRTWDGWRASVLLSPAAGPPQLWSIRQDAHVWRER
ncbi:MAG: carbohydrate-binding family 9-like protein [Verrucomicrobiota bacterium]